MNNEPVAVFVPAPLRNDESKRRFNLNWIGKEPTGIANLYSEELVRQQQAEIEALKAGGEPVAWMNSNGNIIPNDVKEAEKVDDFVFKSYSIPLYTRPAKTLPDDEIWKLWQAHLNDEIPVFARALLKKGSEQ
jgi:hypothetical protein